MDGVPDEVVAGFAHPQLDQGGGARRHLDPADPRGEPRDQLETRRVRGHRAGAGVRDGHGDAVEAHGQAHREPLDEAAYGGRERLPFVVRLRAVQQQEGGAIGVVHQVEGELGRVVVGPGVLDERHHRAPGPVIQQPVDVEGRDLLGVELVEQCFRGLAADRAGVHEPVEDNQHDGSGEVVTGAELIEVSGVTHLGGSPFLLGFLTGGADERSSTRSCGSTGP